MMMRKIVTSITIMFVLAAVDAHGITYTQIKRRSTAQPWPT